MYTIIKLLLLGSEDAILTAGALVSHLKEEKIDNELVYMIIYKNLNNLLQLKWKISIRYYKQELDKIKKLDPIDSDLHKQIILHKSMPTKVKSAALEKADEMKTQSNDYYKQQMYVKTLLKYPWASIPTDIEFYDKLRNNTSKCKTFLDNVRMKLNNKVYGHAQCKDRLIELIGKWISRPISGGTVIGLVGPPGVGKTLIAKGIGDALGVPFVQITLGGQNDGELLYGHGYTYTSAQPGLIVKKMCEAGNARTVLYFDELDKTAKKNDSNEIFSILIHLTDPNINTEFQDRFFQEIDFPLDKAVIVFSYNDSDKIDPILLDRIDEIEIKPYSTNDKVTIAQEFIIKEICEMIGMKRTNVSFDDNTIKYIIEHYTHEAGVRELKRKLEKIFLKLNLDRIYQRNIFSRHVDFVLITESIVGEYLDKPTITITEIHKQDMVGVVNGLYATTSGKGGIIPIQIYSNRAGSEETFTLRLTGCQGDVMKESVLCALTVAVHSVDDDISKSVIKNHPFGFHIHAPNAATPKDGPSAGCAFAIAFISRILNVQIKHNVALTGEIDLIGNCKKIGGLAYKLSGAKKAGVKTILVSDENRDDVETITKEIPDIFTPDFKIIFVKNIKDIMKEILIF
jgi:endopeptidase La